MKCIKTIINVNNIFIFNKSIVIANLENLYINDKTVDIKGYDLYIENQTLYAIFNNKVYVFDENSYFFKRIYDSIISEYRLTENNVITSEYLPSREFEIKYYVEKKLKWSKCSKGLYVVDNSDVILERNIFKPIEISILNNKNGEINWSFQLPEGFKIFDKIQVLKNVLFFIAFKDEGNYNKQYGLDIKTGKILWELNFQIPYTKNNIAFHINPKDNLCYGYGGNLYQVFNPITGEVLVEKSMSNYYEQDIDPGVHGNVIYNNKLWFVSGRRGENAKFGAIDLKTHKMDFIQDYPLENGGQFDKPIYHKDKLYLRDSNSVLHIFKKQENTSSKTLDKIKNNC